jgi:hypothetical protein
LNHWNEEVFGNVEVRKKALLEEIWFLDGLEDERELADEERVSEKVKKLTWRKWLLCKKSVGDRNQRRLHKKKGITTPVFSIVLPILIEETTLSAIVVLKVVLLPSKRWSKIQSFSTTRISLSKQLLDVPN